MRFAYHPARHLTIYMLSSILLAVSVVAGSLVINEHLYGENHPAVISGASEVHTLDTVVIAVDPR